jgi:hypothetical protein
MDKSFFNQRESQCFGGKRDVLSIFNSNIQKPKHIQPGMTVDEIADVVSDHLIEVIRQQFNAAKLEYATKTK